MVAERQFRENLQRILDALNTKNWDALDKTVDELFVPDYVWHLPGLRDVRGRKEVKQVFRHLVESTPGYHATIEDVLAMGDKTAARLLVHRTDPESGQAQHRTSLMLNHLKDGQFAEDWQVAGGWEDG